MRRKLWLLLILFLSLVGRESCCASSASAQEQNQEQDIGQNQGIGPAVAVLGRCIMRVFGLGLLFLLDGALYRYFDLHQKKEGWYTCKFYYAAGYRTKLFYNRIYLDFYSSLPSFLFRGARLKSFLCFFMMNINVRINRDFYIIFAIPVLYYLQKIFLFLKTRFSSQGHKDN